jgi:hypothetical protein
MSAVNHHPAASASTSIFVGGNSIGSRMDRHYDIGIVIVPSFGKSEHSVVKVLRKTVIIYISQW